MYKSTNLEVQNYFARESIYATLRHYLISGPHLTEKKKYSFIFAMKEGSHFSFISKGKQESSII